MPSSDTSVQDGRRGAAAEFRTLTPYLRPYRRGIVFGLILVVLANAFSVAGPWLIGRGVDAMERPGTSLGIVLGFAGLVVLAALLGGAARYGQRELLNGISRRIEVDLRDALFGHLLRLDAAFYSRNRTGDLMSRATNDTQAVRQAVGPGVMYLVNTIAMTAFVLPVMLNTSARLTGIALIPMVLLPPAMLYFGRAIHRRFERIQHTFGQISTFVQENLSGARIVRAYGQESAQEHEFADLNRTYLARNMDLAKVEGLFRPLLGMVAGIGMVIVLWLGGRLVIAGTISIGDFVAFGIYLAMLIWPMIALGWVINLFQRGAASLGRINAVFRTEPVVRQPERPEHPHRIRGEIEFDDVWFRYPGTERDVLQGVSFHVRAGQTVALVGPTGAGKSTIIQLLTRAYDPDRGEVRVDGIALPQLDLPTLRHALGVAPQDAFLFSETVGENIALGFTQPGSAAVDSSDEHGVPAIPAPEDAVREAVTIAQLEETIAELPSGLETRLGERGINLSGGQRQRATLARALVGDPAIVVLDDTLSAVDTHTEAEILRGLRGALADRTAVIVSHRVTAVMNADIILVLDDGRIVQRGTHDQLIAQEGMYAELLRRQLLEEDLETDAVAGSRDAL